MATTEKPANGALAVIPAQAASAGALAPRAPVAFNAFVPDTMEACFALAQRLATSNLVPQALRRAEDCFVVLLTGHELGLTPMQSLRGIHVVEGRPFISADLMVGIVLARPDICAYFRPVVVDAARARFETQRISKPPTPPVEFEYTLDQAKAAGLYDKGKDEYAKEKNNWRRNPADMLAARAKSKLARLVYSDILYGVREADEIDDVIAEVAPSGMVAPTVPARAPTTVVAKAPAAAKTIEQVAAPAPTIDGKPVEDAKSPARAVEREPGADDGDLSDLEKICADFAAAETLDQLRAAAAKWRATKDKMPDLEKRAVLEALDAATTRIKGAP